MAKASPPSDMMLIVLPVSHRPTNEEVRDKGMLIRTTITLRTSWRKIRIIKPVSAGADRSLGGNALNGRPHRRRFVELVTDVHVLGHYRPEERH